MRAFQHIDINRADVTFRWNDDGSLRIRVESYTLDGQITIDVTQVDKLVMRGKARAKVGLTEREE